MNSPLEQFICKQISIIPMISNSTLALFIVCTIYCTLNWLGTQGVWQLGIIKLQNQYLSLTKEHLGEKTEYYPLIGSIFNFIALANLIGLTPLVYTTTTQIIISLGISISIWIGIVILGLVNHGWNFSAGFLPGGTPLILAWILVPIEILSYTARAFSLGLRLCINVATGHLLQIIIADFSQKLIIAGINQTNIGLIIGSILPVIILFLLYFLEFGIMIMQAFVLTTLTAIYISESIEIH